MDYSWIGQSIATYPERQKEWLTNQVLQQSLATGRAQEERAAQEYAQKQASEADVLNMLRGRRYEDVTIPGQPAEYENIPNPQYLTDQALAEQAQADFDFNQRLNQLRGQQGGQQGAQAPQGQQQPPQQSVESIAQQLLQQRQNIPQTIQGQQTRPAVPPTTMRRPIMPQPTTLAGYDIKQQMENKQFDAYMKMYEAASKSNNEAAVKTIGKWMQQSENPMYQQMGEFIEKQPVGPNEPHYYNGAYLKQASANMPDEAVLQKFGVSKDEIKTYSDNAIIPVSMVGNRAVAGKMEYHPEAKAEESDKGTVSNEFITKDNKPVIFEPTENKFYDMSGKVLAASDVKLKPTAKERGAGVGGGAPDRKNDRYVSAVDISTGKTIMTRSHTMDESDPDYNPNLVDKKSYDRDMPAVVIGKDIVRVADIVEQNLRKLPNLGTAKMLLIRKAVDPHAFGVTQASAMAALNENEKKLARSILQAREVILGVRKLAGMAGVGKDMREAMQATMPGGLNAPGDWGIEQIRDAKDTINNLLLGVPENLLQYGEKKFAELDSSKKSQKEKIADINTKNAPIVDAIKQEYMSKGRPAKFTTTIDGVSYTVTTNKDAKGKLHLDYVRSK